MKKGSEQIPYMGFIVDPYCLFLAYQIKDIDKAQTFLPDAYEIAEASIFDKGIKKPIVIVSGFSARTSAFIGMRLEFYIIARHKKTGLLSWIITDYENKALDDKVKNLILYIRKKSPQYGDNVLLEAEKDYPITYSLGPEGFTEILNNAIEQGLIESTESGFKLTERGWTIGTELMESKEGGEQ